MIARKMAWVAGTLVLFAGAALAQTSAISGEVKGEDGKPLKDAVVKIERKDIKGNYKTKTNKKGEYYHGGLPLGTYDVTVEVNGRDADKVGGVRTRLGDPTPINFDLQKKAKEQAALQAAAASGTLTQEQARQMTPEQRAALEKQMKQQQAAMAKNKALNDAFNTGMQALQAKQYDQAIEAFKKAGEMGPDQHVVWAHLGDSYMGLSQTKTGAEQEQLIAQGIEAWNKAISLAPTDAGYHNNFALALVKAKKFDEAKAELEKAAQLDPANAGKYYYNLGAVLVNSGQNERASEEFKRAIQADPNYAEAHYQYGLSLMAKATTTADGKIVPPPGTKEEFEKYMQLAPNGPNTQAAQAMIQTIDSQIQTTYENPNAPKKSQKKGKK